MPERIDFWGIPQPWGPVLVYLLVTAGFLVMLVRLFLAARFWSQVGRLEARRDKPIRRLGNVLRYAVLQVRLFGDIYPGLMHAGLAWGFLVFFLGTALATINSHVFHFLSGSPYLVYKLILDLFTVIFLAGAGMAAWRRFRKRPGRLTLAPRFTTTLFILVFIAFNGLLVKSFRLAVQQPAWAAWSPAGWLLASLWNGLQIPETALHSAHLVSYSLHFLTVAVFFATLPAGTLLHIFTGALNVYFADLDRPLGKAKPLPLDSLGRPIYASTLGALSWKQLLDGDACTECGRCQDACPAYKSGTPLNPKTIITTISGSLHTHRTTPGTAAASRPLVGKLVSSAELWACTTCAACVQACPVLVGHLDTITDMRRSLVNDGRLSPQLQEALTSLQRYGNAFGELPARRGDWTSGLPFHIKDARSQPVQYLWLTGDTAAFNPDLVEQTRLTASLFQHIGLDFGILYDGEVNSGCDARRVGEEGLFELLSTRNCAVLEKSSFKAILTTDPHTYNTLRHEYPQDVLAGRPVLHSTQLLDGLITSGSIRLNPTTQTRVTYHDPCYLGRYNGVYTAPRRILQAAGCELLEMPRSRENSYCCGAGGGRIWMEEGSSGERPAESRLHEAAALPDVQALVTACPKDMVMYRDALISTGLEKQLEVLDIIQVVESALQPIPVSS